MGLGSLSPGATFLTSPELSLGDADSGAQRADLRVMGNVMDIGTQWSINRGESVQLCFGGDVFWEECQSSQDFTAGVRGCEGGGRTRMAKAWRWAAAPRLALCRR